MTDTERIDKIAALLADANASLEEACKGESWGWAMNEMSDEVSEYFCAAGRLHAAIEKLANREE